MEQKQVSLLVEENLKTIYAYSLSRVSHKQDAEDLAGDIIVAILESAPRIRDDDAFFGYIWAIAGNTYKKYLRKKKTRLYTELEEGMVSDEGDLLDELCRSDEINRLRRELSILSREHRECTVAYYIDGLSCLETSRKLGISLEMVKYYLFKTRKILKEGIDMEREFGERSYHPSFFEFSTIFSGQFNREYRNLFNRKLPGNILVSAYYTPMTVRELSVELGVASVYLEDEIALLRKYNLLTELTQGKYQTNLVIFTEAYQEEFIKTVGKEHLGQLADILRSIKKKLPEIRSVGFHGAEFDDNHLMWAFLFDLIREGNSFYEEAHPISHRSNPIYDGATGINYGVNYSEYDGKYGCSQFAGFAGIGPNCYVSYANFGILPKENHYTEAEDLGTSPRVTKKQKQQIDGLLVDEIHELAVFYSILSKCAADIMKQHAPKSVWDMVEDVIAQTIFFRTVGIIGALAVQTGEMTIPSDGRVKPMLICDFTFEGSPNSDVMVSQ